MEEAPFNTKNKEVLSELLMNINKALNSFKCSKYQYGKD